MNEILLIIKAFAISNSTNLNQPENYFSSFENLGIFISLLAIFVSIFLYGFSKRREKWNLLQTAYKTVLNELATNRDDFKNSQKYQIVQRNLDGGKQDRVDYTNGFFDTYAFDTLIKSGQFSHLHMEAQSLLSDLYSRIKGHNQYLEYIDTLTDNFALSTHSDINKLNELKKRYEILITEYEDQVLEFLPQIERILIREIDKTFIAFLIFFWSDSY